MNTLTRTILAILCIFIVTVCTVLIVAKAAGRAGADLTEEKLYTLSDGTRNIVEKLGTPVKLKLYYARTAALKGPEAIRFYNNYFLYVRDLLAEYTRLSDGMLEYVVVDPRKFTPEEDEALKAGVKKFPLSEDENFYFGLVATTELGNSETIPFFEPERQEFVEYDISRLISSAAQPEKRTIGVLSSIPVMGDEMSPYMMQMLRVQGREPQEPWGVTAQLKKDYELERIAPDADHIHDHVDYLLIVHPKDLPKKTLFVIDQFVMRGGKLMVFTDPHCLNDLPPQDPNNMAASLNYKFSSDLNALLRGWGVEMEPERIAVDRTLAITASPTRGAPAEPFLPFMELTEDCVNKHEVVTAKLDSVRVIYAGSLIEVPGAETEVTPLLTTSKVGNTWKPSSRFELQMPRPQKIAAAVRDGVEPVMLACRISGKLKSNFPDGLEEEADDKEAKAENEHAHDHAQEQDHPLLKESQEETAVFVFADVDVISDMLAFRDTFFGPAQVGDNASLLFNAIEYLGGSNDLIAIRSRGKFNRPFTRVDDIEADLEKETQDEVNRINEKIEESKESLRKLGVSNEGEDERILQSKVVAEREKILEEIREYRKKLRELNAGKRAELERLKMALMGFTTFLAPLVILAIALVLALVRFARAKLYAARRVKE